MSKPLRSAAGVVAFFAILASAASPALAAAFTVTTFAGAPVRLGSHATWDASCQGTPARVEIVEPPQHGRLSSREEAITINRVDYGSRRCLGHTVEGRAVYYEPQPGFVGTDRFYYTSLTRTGRPIPHAGTVVVR